MSAARANRPPHIAAELEADEAFAADKDVDAVIVEAEPAF
jgi:hypothetical protein